MGEDDNDRSASRDAASKVVGQSSSPAGTMFRSNQTSASAHQGAVDEDTDAQSLTPDMQQLIGRQLRAVYDDVAKQPVPDRFLELMKQLDGKTGSR